MLKQYLIKLSRHVYWRPIIHWLLPMMVSITTATIVALWFIQLIVQPELFDAVQLILLGVVIPAGALLSWLFLRTTQSTKLRYRTFAASGLGIAFAAIGVSGAAGSDACGLVKLHNRHLAAWWGPHQERCFAAWLDYARPHFSHKRACLEKPQGSKEYGLSLKGLRSTLAAHGAKPQQWQAQPLQFERVQSGQNMTVGEGRYGVTGGCRVVYAQVYYAQKVPGIPLFVQPIPNHLEQRPIGDIGQCCPGDRQCLQHKGVRFRLQMAEKNSANRSAGQSGLWLLVLANKPWPETFKTGKDEWLKSYHDRLVNYVIQHKGQGLEIDYQELIEDPN